MDLEQAVGELFPVTGSRPINVKFFRGRRQGVTAAELLQQVVDADRQIAQGLQPVNDIDR